MALMEFTDKMKCGVAEIDRQHGVLIDIVNALYQVGLGRSDISELQAILADLTDYLEQHLIYEEELLAAQGYGGLGQHKREHDALRKRVVSYQKQMSGGRERLVALDLLHFLKQWLQSHIMVTDKDACAFLNGKGIG